MADQISYVGDDGVRVFCGYEDHGAGKLLYFQRETGGSAVRVPADSADAEAARAAHPELAELDQDQAAEQTPEASAEAQPEAQPEQPAEPPQWSPPGF